MTEANARSFRFLPLRFHYSDPLVARRMRRRFTLIAENLEREMHVDAVATEDEAFFVLLRHEAQFQSWRWTGEQNLRGIFSAEPDQKLTFFYPKSLTGEHWTIVGRQKMKWSILADSPEILHHTVWRTLPFHTVAPYSYERLYIPILTTSLIRVSVGRRYFLSLEMGGSNFLYLLSLSLVNNMLLLVEFRWCPAYSMTKLSRPWAHIKVLEEMLLEDVDFATSSTHSLQMLAAPWGKTRRTGISTLLTTAEISTGGLVMKLGTTRRPKSSKWASH